MTKIISLVDNFSIYPVDSSRWDIVGNPVEVGEGLRVEINNLVSGVISRTDYDLTRSQVKAKIKVEGDFPLVFFTCIIRTDSDVYQEILIKLVNDSISFSYAETAQLMGLPGDSTPLMFPMSFPFEWAYITVVPPVIEPDPDPTTIPYDPIQHAWWRIRERVGALYWETSPDALRWTVRRKVSHNLDVSKVDFYILSGSIEDILNNSLYGSGVFGLGPYGGVG